MLITDWKTVATKSWSMWIFYALFAIEAITLGLEAMGGTLGVSESVMSLVVMFGSACGGIARLLYQGIQEAKENDNEA